MIEINQAYITAENHTLVSDLSLTLSPTVTTIFLSKRIEESNELLRAISGLRELERGQITINGSLVGTPDSKRKIVTVLETPLLNEHMTPRENLQRLLYLRTGHKHRFDKMIEHYSQTFLLQESLDKRTGLLTKGIRRGFETLECFIIQPQYFVLIDLIAYYPDFFLGILVSKLHKLSSSGTGIVTSICSIDIAEILSEMLAFEIVVIENGRIGISGQANHILDRMSEERKTLFRPRPGTSEFIRSKRALQAIQSSLKADQKTK